MSFLILFFFMEKAFLLLSSIINSEKVADLIKDIKDLNLKVLIY